MHFLRIKKNEYYVPSKVGPLAKGLIQKLLQHEPTKRPTVAEILRVSCCSPYSWVQVCLVFTELDLVPAKSKFKKEKF
jgi:hypothetical protein